MKTIIAKLGNMKKAVEWVVYPPTGGHLKIQSDHRMCRFDPVTGEGILGGHKASYSSFTDLMMPTAQKIVVPPEVIKAALEAQPHSGDHIGGNVYIA